MLEFGNKEFRNLQQQVGKNKDDIASLKNGITISYWVANVTDLAPLMIEDNVGKYVVVGTTAQKLYIITKRANGGLIADNLGDWPAKGEKGDTGEQGERGIEGRQPIISVGSGPLPQDDNYKYRDIYIVKVNNGALHKGDLYQKDNNGNWQLKFNLMGPQGLPGGEGDEVIANPEGEVAEDSLVTIKIDGIVYDIPAELTTDDRAMLDALEEYVEFDSEGTATFGNDLIADGNLVANGDVEVGNKIVLLGTGTKADIVDEYGNPIDFGTGSGAAWGSITGTLSAQTDLQTALDAKQAVISDLASIRSGASLGVTALQPNDNVSELVNDAGYLTEHQSLAAYALDAEVLHKSGDEIITGIKTIKNKPLIFTDGSNNETGRIEYTLSDANLDITVQKNLLLHTVNGSNVIQLKVYDRSLYVGYTAFYPYADITQSCGLSNYRWYKVYTQNIDDGTNAIAVSNIATKTEVASKQDTISDLATIRSNASAGAGKHLYIHNVRIYKTSAGTSNTNMSIDLIYYSQTAEAVGSLSALYTKLTGLGASAANFTVSGSITCGSSAAAPFTAKEYFSPSEIRCNNNKIVVMGYGQAAGTNITHSESSNAIDLLAMQTAGETINVSDTYYQVF